MRKLCLFCLPFCIAVLAGCLGLPSPLTFGTGCALFALIFLYLDRIPHCLVCFGLAFGLLWTWAYTGLVLTPARELDGQTAPFTATVTEFSSMTSHNSVQAQVLLHLDGAVDQKVLLYTNSSHLTLSPGDKISGIAFFQLTDTIKGEPTSYYSSKGIYLKASAQSAVTVIHPTGVPFYTWGAYIAHALQESISAIFPHDVSGIMRAFLTGDRSELDDGVYLSLQRSGAAHVVAVSGLHLSFFAGLVGLLFRRRSRAGAAITVVMCFLFAATAGFTPSVMRAAFMVAVTLPADLLGRDDDKPTTLAAALFVLLLLNPYSVLSVSLQLSFGAVAGIYAVTSPMYRAMTRSLKYGGSPARRLGRRLYKAFCANLSLTLGALLLTTPLCALYFGSVSIVSPLTNLLILWAVSILFSAGLVLTLLGMVFPAAASLLSFPVTLLVRYVLGVTDTLGTLSFAALSMDSIFTAVWLIFVYVIILVMVLRRYRRPILPLCIGVLTLCAALLLTRFSLSAPLTVTMLDVGQGQSILLTSAGRTALIDCGGSKGSAGDTAARHLHALGISRLDVLILTHCHDDHANGVNELFSQMEVSALILPEISDDPSPYRSQVLALAKEQGTEVALLSDNRSIALGDAVLTLYAPLGGGSTNEEGLFVQATCGQFDLLVTGDADSFVESLLIKYNTLPDIEVLVAGHHGSQHSTSDLLLDTVMPESCLISVGYNTYGHPSPSILTRLADRNIEVHRTDLTGHITIRVKE